VLTPKGWTLFGKLSVGDEVIGSNGKPTQVTGVFPRGKRQTFRVEFDDGYGVEVSDDHLWRVLDERSGKYSTLSTKSLLESNHSQDDLLRWSIPIVQPVTFNPTPLLPMDPYLFGVFVGCGTLERDGDSDTIILKMELSPQHREEILSKLTVCDFNRIQIDEDGRVRVDSESWSSSLKEFHQSQVIPESYLRSSILNRHRLVQGIFDIRGRISSKSDSVVCAGFVANVELNACLIELIQSLGGIASYDAHQQQLRTTFPPDLCPFSLSELEKQFHNLKKVPSRRINSISSCRQTDVLCISVDAEDHLYVTEHFIVTHNTIQVRDAFFRIPSLLIFLNCHRQFHYSPTWQPIAACGVLI
jgi:phosphate starvation-inducible protein PhoH and related proteins